LNCHCAKVATALPDADAGVNRELSRLLCFLGDTTMIEPLLERMAADTGDRPLRLRKFCAQSQIRCAVSDMLNPRRASSGCTAP
jgi:hypothetical protein